MIKWLQEYLLGCEQSQTILRPLGHFAENSFTFENCPPEDTSMINEMESNLKKN
jgi:hypothetical protein